MDRRTCLWYGPILILDAEFTRNAIDLIVFFATLYQAILNDSKIRSFYEISLFDLVIRDGTLCRKVFTYIDAKNDRCNILCSHLRYKFSYRLILYRKSTSIIS
jgi:hypothetical protein